MISRTNITDTPGNASLARSLGKSLATSLMAAAYIDSCALTSTGLGQCLSQYEITAVIDAHSCGIAGPTPTHGLVIADTGEVVGYYSQCLSGNNEVFYWSESTGMITLDRPAGVVGPDDLAMLLAAWD